MPSEKTVERLSLYRYLLSRLLLANERFVYSHRLARLAVVTAAQVRHDLMAIGYSGSPNQGYDVEKLIESIGDFLDTPLGRNIALFGVGNLGRAILADYSSARPRLKIAAGFDINPDVAGTLVHGCLVHPMEDMARVIQEQQIALAIIAIPAAAAQEVAERCYDAGILGILNFSPLRLQLPRDAFVSDVNISMVLEKVAFFAHGMSLLREGNREEVDGHQPS